VSVKPGRPGSFPPAELPLNVISVMLRPFVPLGPLLPASPFVTEKVVEVPSV